LLFFVFIFSRNPRFIQEDDRLEDEVNFNSVSLVIAFTGIDDKVGFKVPE
jgi:hypothetical protein